MSIAPRDQPSRDDGDACLDDIRAWLADTLPSDFAAEAHRQSLLAARSPHAEEDQAFVDSISDVFSD